MDAALTQYESPGHQADAFNLAMVARFEAEQDGEAFVAKVIQRASEAAEKPRDRSFRAPWVMAAVTTLAASILGFWLVLRLAGSPTMPPMAETNEGGWVLSDAALAKVVKAVRRTLGSPLTQRDDRQPIRDTGPVNWVTYKNATGTTVPPYGVLAPTTSFSVIKDSTAADASIVSIIPHMGQPSTVFQRRFAVGDAAGTTSGGIGLCTYEGPCMQRYSTSATPAMGDGYGPKPGSFDMWPGYACTTIVDGVVSATNRVMIGSLDPIAVALGKTTGAVTGGSPTSSYQIYVGGIGGEANSGIAPPSAISRSSIASGKWVRLTWINNAWEMEALQC